MLQLIKDACVGQASAHWLRHHPSMPQAALELIVDSRAGRGRPPGSKNKPKIKPAEASGVPKRKGRPPGSRNKEPDLGASSGDDEPPQDSSEDDGEPAAEELLPLPSPGALLITY